MSDWKSRVLWTLRLAPVVALVALAYLLVLRFTELKMLLHPWIALFFLLASISLWLVAIVASQDDQYKKR